MSRQVTAAFYVVLQPELNWNGDYVRGIRADRLRKGKPEVSPGELAVKVKLNFDADSLLETVPVVEQTVAPEDYQTQPTPEIEVGDG